MGEATARRGGGALPEVRPADQRAVDAAQAGPRRAPAQVLRLRPPLRDDGAGRAATGPVVGSLHAETCASYRSWRRARAPRACDCGAADLSAVLRASPYVLALLARGVSLTRSEQAVVAELMAHPGEEVYASSLMRRSRGWRGMRPHFLAQEDWQVAKVIICYVRRKLPGLVRTLPPTRGYTRDALGKLRMQRGWTVNVEVMQQLIADAEGNLARAMEKTRRKRCPAGRSRTG
jgi:hypothetical protein